ncbi:uncharacterized protein LOC114934242 [Nylanderia fulva]|uniref:uncharacterized protein LOC114934242 n=1 Tax=Nylanderia fulva TaxID=613905 RepID=UPI0010FB210C|nr:uncharacterized protein LOC114934242 [Nylanderia fulva]XP_029162725.1 uncharacterized protein LOC114934242 [Nylanderia fulva]XP_029162726.1 uncharacterized protein LOC114934242 [Nylanderia fulva]
MKKDLSVIQQEFEEIYNISFQTGRKQEKVKEDIMEEVERNIACTTTSTATQKHLEKDSNSSKDLQALEQLKDEITEKLEKIDLTKPQMTDNMPSEIDDEKSETMKDNKYLQFMEIVYHSEIQRVIAQIKNYIVFFYFKNKDNNWNIFNMRTEYVMHQNNLVNKFLELADKMLKFKLEKRRIIKEKKTIHVKSNMPCEIDYEKRKLMTNHKYLWFVIKIQQKEVNRIFVQLQTYCDRYNMPNKEENIAAHRDFIVQRIKLMEKASKKKLIAFNFQIELDAMNMETNDVETSNISSKSDIKNTLMKHNKYLRYIAMKHQKEIDRVYAELQIYCDRYMVIVNIAMCLNFGADDVEKTNRSSEIDENSELRDNNENLQCFLKMHQEEFIKILDQLKMYRDNMLKETLTIIIHAESYDPMKTNDEENKLKIDNKYLAFIAMMHLEKIKEICASFEMYRDRFDETMENILDVFWMQALIITKDIELIQNLIPRLQKELELMKMCIKLSYLI